jgi:hypothetical protein
MLKVKTRHKRGATLWGSIFIVESRKTPPHIIAPFKDKRIGKPSHLFTGFTVRRLFRALPRFHVTTGETPCMRVVNAVGALQKKYFALRC